MANDWKVGLLHQVEFLGPDECVHCGRKLTTDYFEDLCEPRVKAKLATMAAELNQPASQAAENPYNGSLDAKRPIYVLEQDVAK